VRDTQRIWREPLQVSRKLVDAPVHVSDEGFDADWPFIDRNRSHVHRHRRALEIQERGVLGVQPLRYWSLRRHAHLHVSFQPKTVVRRRRDITICAARTDMCRDPRVVLLTLLTIVR
jgi:hypothetical protein